MSAAEGVSPWARHTKELVATGLIGVLLGAVGVTGPTATHAQRRRRRPGRDTPAAEPTPPAEEPQRSDDSARTLSDADRAQARALFQAGAAAVDAGRWADAVTSFRDAYALTGAPSALFNTGFALRALGRYREARDAFTELATLTNVADAMRTQAADLLAEVRQRIARVRLTGLDDAARYGVRIDGVGVEDAGERPMVLDADPGAHAVDVALTGFELFTWSGTLADGASTDVPITLVPLPGGQTGGGGGSVADEAWFWLLIGGVVLVGGGLATYFVLDDAAQLRGETEMMIRL